MPRNNYPNPSSNSDKAQEPAVVPTVFTTSQMVLLRMFSRDRSEEKAAEIQ